MDEDRSVAVEAARAAAGALVHEGTQSARALEAAAEICASRFPDDAWIGHALSDATTPPGGRRMWIAGIHPHRDPLSPTACVSVALIQGGAAEAAAIMLLTEESAMDARRGASAAARLPAANPTQSHLATAKVAVCRDEIAADEGRLRGRVGEVLPVETIAHGLAMVATGRVQGVYTMRRLDPVEVCAGSLLVEESGGVVTDRFGRPLTFRAGQPALAGILAASAALWGQLFDLLRVPEGRAS